MIKPQTWWSNLKLGRFQASFKENGLKLCKQKLNVKSFLHFCCHHGQFTSRGRNRATSFPLLVKQKQLCTFTLAVSTTSRLIVCGTLLAPINLTALALLWINGGLYSAICCRINVIHPVQRCHYWRIKTLRLQLLSRNSALTLAQNMTQSDLQSLKECLAGDTRLQAGNHIE